MLIPEGKTEGEVLASIEKCVSILARSFAFGYYTPEDMMQEARLFCIECLPKFDPARNLDAFLYSAVKHRLINIHRNKFKRADSPCKICHRSESSGGNRPPCTGTGSFCDRYLDWKQRNSSKAKLVNPSNIEHVTDEQAERLGFCCNSEAEAACEIKETLELVDLHLPAELRSAYLKMRDGVAVPKETARAVTHAVQEILSRD